MATTIVHGKSQSYSTKALVMPVEKGQFVTLDVISDFWGDKEIVGMHLSPEAARELAAALIAGAESVE